MSLRADVQCETFRRLLSFRLFPVHVHAGYSPRHFFSRYRSIYLTQIPACTLSPTVHSPAYLSSISWNRSIYCIMIDIVVEESWGLWIEIRREVYHPLAAIAFSPLKQKWVVIMLYQRYNRHTTVSKNHILTRKVSNGISFCFRESKFMKIVSMYLV